MSFRDFDFGTPKWDSAPETYIKCRTPGTLRRKSKVFGTVVGVVFTIPQPFCFTGLSVSS
jgi:hypothetical protein